MKTEAIVDYYASLNYESQRQLLVAMMEFNKQPPYYINFKLDATGLNKLAKVTAYCQKNEIAFKAERSGTMCVKYRFNGMSERNAVLIGQLTL